MEYFAISLLVVGLAFFLWGIYFFAKADGDLTILRQAPLPPNAFKDKVVWITGASQGIGETLSKEFASHGAKLILSARRLPELERVKASLSGLHAPSSVVLLPLDVTGSEDVLREAVEKAEASFDGKGVDIMVHNASAARPKHGYSEISEETTKTSFAVNVIGVITLTRILAPKMAQRGRGQFAVLSSVAAKIGAPGQSVYSASKSAQYAYFDAVRSEIGYTGVKVSLICPGPVKTDPTSSDPRQSLDRVVELIMKSIFHELDESWIAEQPILAMVYLRQHFPSIASFIMGKLGPKRVKTGGGYSLGEMLKKND
ncbi:dehydrogenase/reductase SDR family member 7 [Marchantia polymorpha subsp. ruderalis]|uniref:Uncharacterized protein n=2 Tax=Marchantia polymorpha TaxID=3197 RepID=A0AAF6AU41_MARPO|nr:hypothetical protein MARPO_0061s0007 [Marchantia polymorpha]BBM99961.1 hypothetical protein Mp_1g25180 [Marchantia polymorpha subsp. ruderalis]|eukprot:PTQ36725.1 hypothetical protein MARPO_0061s0007 [Marchantia polymorpha]